MVGDPEGGGRQPEHFAFGFGCIEPEEGKIRIVHLQDFPVAADLAEEAAAGIEMPLPPGATAGALALHLGLCLEDVKIIMVNGMHAPSDRLLQDGDRIAYFPAVGGG